MFGSPIDCYVFTTAIAAVHVHRITVIREITPTTATEQFHELVAMNFARREVLVGVFSGLTFELKGVNQELVCHAVRAVCLPCIFEVDVVG
jgi:hypothetical protein